MNAVVANLIKVSPDLSQAIATKISSAISKEFTILAYDENGRISPEGTTVAQAFVLRLNSSSVDPTRFSRPRDLRTTSSSLLLDLLRYGSMGAELVLGKGKAPGFIKPFSTEVLKWQDTGQGRDILLYPTKDGDIPLDFPTIFYATTTQDLTTPYADSPLQTAIQPAIWDQEFQDHLRRAAVKNLLQRLKITIDSEKWMKTLPLDVQQDQKKLETHITDTVNKLEAQLESLKPEDALVIFDTLQADTLQDANRSEDRSIKVLESLISGQLASGAKILPSIIGRGASSAAASSEAMLFMKAVSATQNELNIFYSRILTLAVRLFGVKEASVKFTYADVNLRPELEVESFKVVKQARILDQLSLGIIDDIEASIILSGQLPPEGYQNIAGTYFKVGPVDTKNNDYSNTSVSADGKSNSTQTDKNNKTDAPEGVPGRNSK